VEHHDAGHLSILLLNCRQVGMLLVGETLALSKLEHFGKRSYSLSVPAPLIGEEIAQPDAPMSAHVFARHRFLVQQLGARERR